jgi:hypothetical protein
VQNPFEKVLFRSLPSCTVAGALVPIVARHQAI